MSSPNLRALQATANRFSDVASFAPIATDGGMGTATENAVTKSLQFVGSQGLISALMGIGGPSVSNDVKVSATQFVDIITGQGAGLGAQTAIMQNNTDINDTLTTAATQLGLAVTGPVASSNSGGGGGGSALDFTAPKPPGESSMLGDIARKLGLTTTQAVLFLAMAGGASYLIYKRANGKRGRRR